MKVALKNRTGLVKEVKVGFSWTTFFFGFLVPLLRGDFKWAAIIFLVEVVVGSVTSGFGATIIGIIFAFKYNSLYIKELVMKGYMPESEEARMVLSANGIII